MKTYKITTLKMGDITVDKGSLTRGKDVGQKLEIPIWAAAIEGHGIKAIVDTGIKSTEWVNKNIASVKNCKQASDETMRAALDHLGWKADDVSILVNTHLHYDHCGNNNLFGNAKLYVQKDEWECALNPLPHQKEIYAAELFGSAAVNTTNLVLLEGEYELAEGIVLIRTPGHSGGHQSVIVNTSEGVVCIAADAANLVENITENLLPNLLVNSPAAYKSLEDIRRKSQFVIPGHEPKIKKFQTSGFLPVHL